MTNRHASGLAGEQAAEVYLTAKGMTVLERRYRASDGEIDLILQDGETIVFCEVKARPSGGRGAGLLAVTPAKQRRMTHAALAFLAQREWMERHVRFDVVEMTSQGILYVPNAFLACEEDG